MLDNQGIFHLLEGLFDLFLGRFPLLKGPQELKTSIGPIMSANMPFQAVPSG